MSGNTRDPAQQASDATKIDAARSTQVPVQPVAAPKHVRVKKSK